MIVVFSIISSPAKGSISIICMLSKRDLLYWCFCGQISKRDLSEQGPSLKARIHTRLSIYEALVRLKMKSLASLDPDGKILKKKVEKIYSLLIDAAQACVYSLWRKLKSCEELFASLLSGIAKLAVTREGHRLRALLIPFKHLVVNLCAKVRHLNDPYLIPSLSAPLIHR